jgi:S-adenosylmethionine-diacylglycerol 3-amino-3-carboxypropyl transferase
VELRRAAYSVLEHQELLELIGSRPCEDRFALLDRCLPKLSADIAEFWTKQPELVRYGIGASGKFESYFRKFREKALPLVHSRKTVLSLLEPRDPEARQRFYDEKWNTWRWRLLFQFFFSRFVMGRLGRDPRFFKYVEGSVADRILTRTRHALTELSPAENPYLHWILTGTHGHSLPHALREENFNNIRQNLDRLEVFHGSIEDYLAANPQSKFDGFNLSDIFEYMSEETTSQLYTQLLTAAAPGSRLAYWNMLAPRQCPSALTSRVHLHTNLGADLLAKDKAFFYSAFRVEEVK